MRSVGRFILASMLALLLMGGAAFVPEVAGVESWPVVLPAVLAFLSIVGILAVATVANLVPRPRFIQALLIHGAGLLVCFVAVVYFNVMAAIWLPLRDTQSAYAIIVAFFLLQYPVLRVSEFLFFGTRLSNHKGR